LFLEVPYDPALYFLGEEHDIAIRAWTNGWDIYHAPEVPIYHLYNDKETNTKPRVLHWDAAEDEKRKVRWWQHNERSKARLRAMLYEGADLGVYGLGTQRSLQEFAEFSGIDYLNRVINR
jgi:GT2 family glycosyltransferase